MMGILLLVALQIVGMAEAVEPTEAGYSWSQLATVAGAAAFTLVVVQYIKAPLDNVWKIPTRVLVYLVALITMLCAKGFLEGLTMESIATCVVNAWLAGAAAIGTYESTFAKNDK